MFLENTVNQQEQFGWIEVICGSMFSGKTEELIRHKTRSVCQTKVEIFKPAVDTRYDDEMVVSHNKNEIRSTPVPVAENIRILAQGCDVVGIDEAQFFDEEIVAVCNDLKLIQNSSELWLDWIWILKEIRSDRCLDLWLQPNMLPKCTLFVLGNLAHYSLENRMIKTGYALGNRRIRTTKSKLPILKPCGKHGSKRC